MTEEQATFADDAIASFVARAAPLGSLDVNEIRAGVAKRAESRGPGPELASVSDIQAGGVPVRCYRPVDGVVPAIVYLHGGGWSIGDIASFDRVSRRLAKDADAVVVTVEYRLAPEHPWPASVDDAITVLQWALSCPPELGPVTGRVAVVGDSAGGTLAALACLALRDRGTVPLPDLQGLVYANTDLTGSSASMTEKATGFGLDADMVRFFNRQWVPDQALWSDPQVSPLHASDLSGLPAALIVTAEHDPLRDEAEQYADRLREAGVDVELRREPGMIHHFMLLDEMSPACQRAADRVAQDLHRLLRAG
jgi:acetyl esterase